ncbi:MULTISPECIES: tetracycline resistance MFS efflux pump [Neobacillus]|uniref:Tetracycline resistance MFS efflux pump n=1 Tax=Neobacillus sedimentimangrovi TaxID=2699460 RepID=A0ABS8QFN7_9BACI|nr:tetracycline resistance MFS efflux pump [Neobacillus sedimentimangrovi]AIM15026.1 major facilitator transporter [Bacillus sp. X1(2014)]MCD4837631.1 tetracycline resistance MFS efflux pump [Neobacillus sedimentimangrovi]
MQTKKALPILFAIMFLVMVGFGIIIPVLPFYAEEIGANPTELGLLMAVYSLMQLIFAPYWGRLSDRIGRKPVMMIGIGGLALSFFIQAISTELWMLFAARILGGLLSSANMPTAMAYVADITTEENRGKGMGIVGAAVGLGFVFGPAIGGIFSKISLSMPFYIASASSLVTLILVSIVLKESRQKQSDTSHKKESIWKSFNKNVSVLFFVQLLISLSLSGLEATFAYFAAQKAGLNTVQLGYIFMIMGFAGAMVQGGLVGRWTKKYGESAVIQGGMIVSAIGFALILAVNNFLTAAIFLSIFGIGNGVIRPSVSSLLTKLSTTGHGSSTGLLSSFDSLGRIVGPPLGGWLFSISIGLPYISGAVITIAALALFLVFRQKQMKPSNMS